MAARWTVQEDRALRRLYDARRPIAEIASSLGRSPNAVTARRRQLGMPARHDPSWSPREDALLRAAADRGVPATWLAARLGRSLAAVRRRQSALIGRRFSSRPYRAVEDEAIRACFVEHGDVDVLAQRLGRSSNAVRLRAQALGVHRPPGRTRWTAAEDAIVRDGYADGRTCASVACQLAGRTRGSIAARARKLGLNNYARRWSAEDDALLAGLVVAQRPLAHVARALVRTPDAVRQRCRRLGLSGPPASSADRAGRPWTEHEDDVLRLHAGVNPATLQPLLGRSDLAIAGRLRFLGLRATRERSPHHPASRAGRLTPAERSTIARDLEPTSPVSVTALARRLDVPNATIYRLLGRRAASARS